MMSFKFMDYLKMKIQAQYVLEMLGSLNVANTILKTAPR